MYAWSQSLPQRSVLPGLGTFTTVAIVEEEAGPGDTWGPVAVEVHGTLTLLEVAAVGEESNLRPALCTSANWMPLNRIYEAPHTAPRHRKAEGLPYFSAEGELFGRSQAERLTPRILTRLTFVEGHR